MIITNFKKTKCDFGCDLFNDNSDYLYWEERKVTTDEIEITNYLKSEKNLYNSNILHIGTGTSFIAKNINCKSITGISISKNEINYANNLKINNYKSFFLNKLSKNAFSKFSNYSFDYIIDVNLKSYSCCSKAFEKMFSEYSKLLTINGKILSNKRGMKFSKVLKPVYSFSLRKFFFRRLKEFDGPSSNFLSLNDCNSLAKKNFLKFECLDNKNVISFVKY